MASTGVNMNVADVGLGRAFGRACERICAEQPGTTYDEIGEAFGRRPGWVSEVISGREALKARDVKTATRLGMAEVLVEVNRQSGSLPTFTPEEGRARRLAMGDCKRCIQENAEAVGAILDVASGDALTAGKQMDALREIDEAILALVQTRTLVAGQAVARRGE